MCRKYTHTKSVGAFVFVSLYACVWWHIDKVVMYKCRSRHAHIRTICEHQKLVADFILYVWKSIRYFADFILFPSWLTFGWVYFKHLLQSCFEFYTDQKYSAPGFFLNKKEKHFHFVNLPHTQRISGYTHARFSNRKKLQQIYHPCSVLRTNF